MDKQVPALTPPRPGPIKLRSRHGCIDCRRSKKKCDEAKPSCGLCQRLRRECRWLSSPPAQSQESKRRRSSRDESDQGTSSPVLRRQGLCTQALETRLSDASLLKHSLWSSIELDTTDIRLVYFLESAFWTRMSGESIDHSSSALTIRPELESAQGLGTISRGCLDAMALIFWGTAHHNSAALAKGYEMRGACFRLVRRKLLDQAITTDLLSTVSLMRLFEMVSTDKSNWITHVQGLMQMFQAAGPLAMHNETMRKLYEQNRWAMISVASVTRTRCPFDTHTWKIIPWQHAEKDLLQTLLDVYARIPAIHVAWDARSPLVESDIRSTILDLHAWRQNADALLNASVMQWTTPLWETSISFKTIAHCHAILIFNMMLIVLAQYVVNLNSLDDLVNGPAVHGISLLNRHVVPLIDPLQRAGAAADEIASATAWTLHCSAAGTMYLGGPLLVCYRLWQKTDKKKAAWVADVMAQINSAWKNEFGGRSVDGVLARHCSIPFQAPATSPIEQ